MRTPSTREGVGQNSIECSCHSTVGLVAFLACAAPLALLVLTDTPRSLMALIAQIAPLERFALRDALKPVRR